MKRREVIVGLASAAAWPAVARAQQPAPIAVGFLSGVSQTGPLTSAFLRGLGEQGYTEGRNVEILYRSAEGRYDRLPALATDLVSHQVGVIFATVPVLSVLAAKSATTTIPIVFALGADPVELGLVSSLSRPGGNVTGVNFLALELTAKRLEVLHQIVPAALSVGFLVNPTNSTSKAQVNDAESAARILGLRLTTLNASTPAEIEAAFAILAERQIGAMLVGADALIFNQRIQIAGLAAHHRVASIYESREIVDAGGFMSYGPSISDAYRLAGTYAGRILKGELPAYLPVQRSTRLEMVLNLKAARALGIDVPSTMLARADEVIE
jgi:putative tryptophan/tyrosine transport system substrate-binding protein